MLHIGVVANNVGNPALSDRFQLPICQNTFVSEKKPIPIF